MEGVWEKEFSNNNINWKTIYTNQVWKITERKIGEFNYKLLCNILCTRDKISKWNNNISKNCQYCNSEHSVKHLLFECPRVVNLWQIISAALKFNVKYHHIIIGSPVTNDYIISRNLVLSYSAYSIYKFWILAENGKIRYGTDSLQSFVRKDLFQRSLYVKQKYFKLLVDHVISYL